MKYFYVEWKYQPDTLHTTGIGNLNVSSAVLYSGIPFEKFNQFTGLLNLKSILRNTYYHLRTHHFAPVIRKAWKKQQNI